jgi:hypothetical protein
MVSLPERRYDLAGQVMAEALTIAARDDCPSTTPSASRPDRPDNTWPTLPSWATRGPRRRWSATCVPATATSQGPPDDGAVLANCPFHHLARTYTELV